MPKPDLNILKLAPPLSPPLAEVFYVDDPVDVIFEGVKHRCIITKRKPTTTGLELELKPRI